MLERDRGKGQPKQERGYEEEEEWINVNVKQAGPVTAADERHVKTEYIGGGNEKKRMMP